MMTSMSSRFNLLNAHHKNSILLFLRKISKVSTIRIRVGVLIYGKLFRIIILNPKISEINL